MSSLLTAGERPGIWERIGDLARRVARLEAVRPTIGGWVFDFDNEGGWAYVIANDSTDIGFGELGAVYGETTGNGSLVVSTDPGNTKQGTVYVTPDHVEMALSSSSLSVAIDRAAGTFTVLDGGTPILQMTSGSPDIHGPAGGSLIFDL